MNTVEHYLCNNPLPAMPAEQDRIAELTRERDQLRTQLETVNVNYDLAQSGWHSDHERLVQMREQLADVTRERDELRQQLATVQAEAAAIREALEWYREQVRRSYECTGAGQRIAEQKLIDDAIDAREDRDVAGKALNTTAGRELLDAHAKEIAEREKKIAQQKTSLREMHAGCENYRHTIKRLRDRNAENDERIAELERQLAEQAPLVAIARELENY